MFVLSIMLVHGLESRYIGKYMSLGPLALWTIFSNISRLQPMYHISTFFQKHQFGALNLPNNWNYHF